MTERAAKKWNKMIFKDHWLEVNKVPTRVLIWGVDLKDLTTEVTELFLCISGNPGVTEYYVTFLESLQARTGVPVWMISHAGKISIPCPGESIICFANLWAVKGLFGRLA